MEKEFEDFCDKHGIIKSENNSDLLGYEPTVEEFYWLLYGAFLAGKETKTEEK